MKRVHIESNNVNLSMIVMKGVFHEVWVSPLKLIAHMVYLEFYIIFKLAIDL